MIRTGYLRWEIEAEDRQSPQDRMAREIVFRARPTFRRVRVKGIGALARAAAENFRDGTGTFEEYQAAMARQWEEVEYRVPDVGPHVYRYSEDDRYQTPGFWITKVRQEARVFAHQVVREASSLTQLVVESPALRLGYARLVAWETLRVIEGKSRPQPTNETEPITIEGVGYEATGIPELVAAELVRDVLDPKEFVEFSTDNRVTIRNGGKIYRISRRTQAMIDVWDETGKPLAKLCVVFRDPGMPPSDEVVMKYLLARHEPEMLWKIGNRFPPLAKNQNRPPGRTAAACSAGEGMRISGRTGARPAGPAFRIGTPAGRPCSSAARAAPADDKPGRDDGRRQRSGHNSGRTARRHRRRGHTRTANTPSCSGHSSGCTVPWHRPPEHTRTASGPWAGHTRRLAPIRQEVPPHREPASKS